MFDIPVDMWKQVQQSWQSISKYLELNLTQNPDHSVSNDILCLNASIFNSSNGNNKTTINIQMIRDVSIDTFSNLMNEIDNDVKNESKNNNDMNKDSDGIDSIDPKVMEFIKSRLSRIGWGLYPFFYIFIAISPLLPAFAFCLCNTTTLTTIGFLSNFCLYCDCYVFGL